MHKRLQVGDRIRITGYSPFRELTGSVQSLDVIGDTEDSPCFYLVHLEYAYISSPLWFLDDEVESISSQEMEYLHGNAHTSEADGFGSIAS
jgi:hypothetical protein